MALRRVCFVSVVLWLCLGQAHTVGYNSHTAYGRNPTTSEASVTASQTTHNAPLPNQQLVTGNDMDTQSKARQAAYSVQCSASTRYLGSYPQGFINGPNGVDSIYFLQQSNDLSESQCLQQCCSLGPLHCQYMWRFKDKCFAVHCSPLSSNCDPQSAAPKAVGITAYTAVQYHNINPVYQFQMTQTPAVPSPLDAYLPHVSSPPQLSSSSPSVSHNSPPIAVISPLHVKTNSTEVTLSAQRSSPEQGIVHYLWQLVSVQPPRNEEGVFIKGSNIDTLHLSALLPGNYTVRLTITDTAGRQNSTTGSVVVVTANPVPPSHSVQHPLSSTTAGRTKGTNKTETTEHTAAPASVRAGDSPTAAPASVRAGDSPTKDHLTTESTTASQTVPNMTTTTTTTKHQPVETVVVQDMTTGAEISSKFNWSLLMKVGIPVLAIVVLILLVSAALVAISSCAFVQAEKRQYRYRKLRYTETA